MTIIERTNFWKQHIKLWKESGLTQSEYCKKNKMTKQIFSKWKIKLFDKKEKTKFVEISTDDLITESSKSDITLILNDSIKINLDINYNEELLTKVLKLFGVAF